MYLSQLLVLSFALSYCSGYSSVEKLKTVSKIDKNVADVLTEHLKSIENYNTLINHYLTEYTQLKLYDGNAAENPLLSYQMIRRIVLNRKQITNQFHKISSDLLEDLEEALEGNILTYEDNLLEAGEAILRLQETYLLHPHDILEGKLKHIQTLTNLTISDCLFLAKVAEEGFKYDIYVEWAEEAHMLCLKRTSYDACMQLTLPLYDSARLKHDEIRSRLLRKRMIPQGNSTETNSEEGDNDAWTSVLPNATSLIEPSKQCSQLIETETFTYEDEQTRLCYKGSLLNESQTSALYCYYLSRPDDVFLTLNRYKVEVRSISPRIISIFEVLTEEETELIKSLATPRLKRSLARSNNTGVVSRSRVSETSWLSDDDHPTLTKISKRIESITGLNVLNDSEHFQVVNYGLGGMYNQHYDFFKTPANSTSKSSPWSNRLATFILYLNDVALGGATVFPAAKVAVPAVKGSATLWYNFNSIGLENMDTLHAGCPVLYGSKWIANKWIHDLGQLFKFKCPLEKPAE